MSVAVSIVFVMRVLQFQCTRIAGMLKVRFGVATEFAQTLMASHHGSTSEMAIRRLWTYEDTNGKGASIPSEVTFNASRIRNKAFWIVHETHERLAIRVSLISIDVLNEL
jgi:hypothetical protein